MKYQAIIQMSRIIKAKYIDQGTSSRVSSPSKSILLPTIPSRRLDNFSFSIRRHSSFQQNPEPDAVPPLRYHATEEIKQHPLQRYKLAKEKKEKEEREIHWLSQSVNMKELPPGELLRQRVEENTKHYGAGMLRRSHKNSLGIQGAEHRLVELHYRLKRQREAATIQREQKAAAARFRSLLSRYESI